MKLWPNLQKLLDYVPKEMYFTSCEEARYIRDTLKFDECSDDDLYNYRTLVVSIWGKRMSNIRQNETVKIFASEHKEPEYGKFEQTMESMQSITMVLDGEMIKRGMEV